MIIIGLLLVAAVAAYFYVNDAADVTSGGDVLGNVETNTTVSEVNVPKENIPTQTNTPAQVESVQQNTVTQAETPPPEQNTTTETPVETEQTPESQATEEASDQVRDSAEEGNTTGDTQTSEQAQRPEETSTQANNALTDGINNAYFAKEIYIKKGNELSENNPYTYTFNNNQNFSNKTKDTVAGEILNIINKLLDEKTFAKKEVILSSLTADSYKGRRQNNDVGDTVTFNIYKKQLEYKKIDNASIGNEVYVVAETTNLDGKEVTITIQEKEKLLVEKEAPLNIIEVQEGIKEKESSTLKEITEIKAKVTDGKASKKIKLRPKEDEELKKWKDKLAKNEFKKDFLWLKVKPEGDKTEFLKEEDKYFELSDGCIDTWDSTTNNRIKALNIKLRCPAKNFINNVERELNIKLRITSGYRSFASQTVLYNQGRTTPGDVVTNAKAGRSYHNYGLAIDVCEIKDGAANWNVSMYNKIAPYGKKEGFEWGGDWTSFIDRPHFQIINGNSTSELLKLYNDNNQDYTKIEI